MHLAFLAFDSIDPYFVMNYLLPQREVFLHFGRSSRSSEATKIKDLVRYSVRNG